MPIQDIVLNSDSKIKLKSGRITKKFDKEKIALKYSSSSIDDSLKPFLLPIELAWSISDGVIGMDSNIIIYKMSPKRVKQSRIDSSIPPRAFKVFDFDEIVNSEGWSKSFTDGFETLVPDEYRAERILKDSKFTKEELQQEFYDYWTNDCILIFNRNQDVFISDVYSLFNSLYPMDSDFRKETFGDVLVNLKKPMLSFIATNIFSGYYHFDFMGTRLKTKQICKGNSLSNIPFETNNKIGSIGKTIQDRLFKLLSAPSNLDLSFSANLYLKENNGNCIVENVTSYHKIFIELSKEHKDINSKEEARDWYSHYFKSAYVNNELNTFGLPLPVKGQEDTDYYDYILNSKQELVSTLNIKMAELLAK